MTTKVQPSDLGLLTDDEHERLEAILQAPEPVGFREFVDEVHPDYRWYWYCERIADRLTDVVEGRLNRLMVFAPPRHGKSELIGRLLPAYYLYRYPTRQVGITSYGARLAVRELSMHARSYYRRFGGELSEEASAKKQWRNPEGGEVWAAGVGGSITGAGYHLGIIDDPVKGAEEARSETHRETNRDWYDAEFATREEPGGAQVIVQTRWHELDLSGWLLDRERQEPEGWHIMHFPAIYEGLPDYPESCTVELDPRDEGEPLCPERKPLSELEAYRNRRPYYFSALFQGKPRPREGGMFTRDHFEAVDASEVPDKGEVIRYWDRASTSGGGDYTVGVKARWYPIGGDEHRFVIEDVERGQWGTNEREDRFSQIIDQDGPDVKQWIEEEGGSSGKDAVRATAQRNPGYTIEGDPVTGSKGDRADPLASWGATDNIYLVRAPWNDTFIRELTGFPNARHDDQVDAASGAYSKLAVAEEDERQEFMFV